MSHFYSKPQQQPRVVPLSIRRCALALSLGLMAAIPVQAAFMPDDLNPIFGGNNQIPIFNGEDPLAGISKILGGGNPLQEIFDLVFKPTFQGSLVDYGLDALSKVLGGSILGEAEGAWNESLGSLGIPDPLKAGAIVEEIIKTGRSGNPSQPGGDTGGWGGGTGAANTASPPDAFEVSRTVYGAVAENEMHRQSSLMHLNGVIGEAGQTQTRKDLEVTQQLVNEDLNTSTAAQKLDVTQDVMKSMITMNARQSVMSAAIRGDTLKLRQDIQYNTLAAVDASRTLDELARDNRVKASASAMHLLEISGQARLN